MPQGQKIIDFIKYNNATTIIFTLVFFSFGVSFAASPEVRDSVYSSEETVVSVDNGMIVSADLDNFNFNLRINSITEDEKNYYAAYSYQVLAIEDGFWQNKVIEKTLKVSKEALDGKDLGLYVAKELGDNINYELAYLKKVQKLEREKGESQKVVTVEYSGLIGKLLDPKDKVIEGYDPVIPEPLPEVLATVESNPAAVIVSVLHDEPLAEPAEDLPTGQAGLPTGQAGMPANDVQPVPEPMADEAGSTLEPTVDAELVQDVVEELIQENATSTPIENVETQPSEDLPTGQAGLPTDGVGAVAGEAEPADPTPEAVSEPEPEAAPTPEVTPEPETVSEPVLESPANETQPAPEEATSEPEPETVQTPTQ